MRDNDPRTEAARQFSHEADLGLWYKDRQHFVGNYDEFIKTADVTKMGERELVELYELAQSQLAGKIHSRDNPIAMDQQEAKELSADIQDRAVTPRFAFLEKMRAELEKKDKEGKLAAKGLKLPPTMEQRAL